MNMENKKQLITLGAAFACGFLAVVLVAKYVNDSVQAETQRLAADYKKQTGALVQEIEGMKGALKKMNEQQAALAKRQAAAPAAAGGAAQQQPVAMDIFSLRTPPGKRALTVLIDTLSAVGGLISPGDFVDIIGHLNIPDEGLGAAAKNKSDKEKVISVLFQNIQVLAVGSNFNPIGSAPKYQEQQKSQALHVTLALTPEEAALITFAQDNGKLQLTLRSPAEQEQAKNLEVASWDALSRFLKENQGVNIKAPKSHPKADSDEAPEVKEEDEGDEIKPFIQIFKSGRESKL